jgi:hypothetical protein
LTWQPKVPATDVRAIVPNFVSYLKANQADVFAWLSPSPLANFEECYQDAQVFVEKDFPHFGVVRERYTIDDADDGRKITCELTAIIEVYAKFAKSERADALSQLLAETKNRVYAVESVWMNIPRATLFADIGGTKHDEFRVMTGFDVIESASETEALFNAQMNLNLKFTENPA